MLKLLNEFDTVGIDYVSWKNNHELHKAIAGKSDLDIVVSTSSKERLIQIANQNEWLELINPVAKYGSIMHFFKVNTDGTFAHIHVYFGIVTGESWLKEFDLPLFDVLMSHKEREKNSNIWVLSRRAQGYIFAIRHLLKTGSITSRILYKKNIDAYKNEWLKCQVRENDLHNFGPILLNDFTSKSGLFDEFDLPPVQISKNFRKFNWGHLRLSRGLLFPMRMYHLISRLLNKLYFKQRKLFVGSGIIVVFSGTDGCGKSTIVGELHSVFSNFMSCKVLTVGKPQGYFLEQLRKIIYGERNKSPNLGTSENITDYSLRRAIGATTLAFIRLWQTKKAKKLAQQGKIVIVDRWPTNQWGKMDSAKISVNSQTNLCVLYLAKLERFLYKLMPNADLCFILKVTLENAIIRNENRIKIGKETEQEIINRYTKNIDTVPKSRKIVFVDNNAELQTKMPEIIKTVWSEICFAKN